jgi:hypothetical protein
MAKIEIGVLKRECLGRRIDYAATFNWRMAA